VPGSKRPPPPIEKARRRLVERLKDEPGFVGVGVSAGSPGQYEIIVLVADRRSPVLAKVPSEWEGLPVRTEIAGIPKRF